MTCTCSDAQLYLVGCDCAVAHENDPYVFAGNTGEAEVLRYDAQLAYRDGRTKRARKLNAMADNVDRYPAAAAPDLARISALGAEGALVITRNQPSFCESAITTGADAAAVLTSTCGLSRGGGRSRHVRRRAARRTQRDQPAGERVVIKSGTLALALVALSAPALANQIDDTVRSIAAPDVTAFTELLKADVGKNSIDSNFYIDAAAPLHDETRIISALVVRERFRPA